MAEAAASQASAFRELRCGVRPTVQPPSGSGGDAIGAGGVAGRAGASHVPVATLQVEAVAQAARLPRGVPEIAPHAPGVPSHASHWPLQALSQHTPSTQNPLAQASADAHVAPLELLGLHMPALHHAVAAHAALVVHDSAQSPPMQAWGAQSVGVAPHVPVALHVWLMLLAPEQWVAPHTAPVFTSPHFPSARPSCFFHATHA